MSGSVDHDRIGQAAPPRAAGQARRRSRAACRGSAGHGCAARSGARRADSRPTTRYGADALAGRWRAGTGRPPRRRRPAAPADVRASRRRMRPAGPPCRTRAAADRGSASKVISVRMHGRPRRRRGTAWPAHRAARARNSAAPMVSWRAATPSRSPMPAKRQYCTRQPERQAGQQQRQRRRPASSTTAERIDAPGSASQRASGHRRAPPAAPSSTTFIAIRPSEARRSHALPLCQQGTLMRNAGGAAIAAGGWAATRCARSCCADDACRASSPPRVSAPCWPSSRPPMVRRHDRAPACMDRPDARKAHSHPTPKGGGVGIVVAFLLGITRALSATRDFARLADPYFRGVHPGRGR